MCRKMSTHTLHHRYARHLLKNGIPINYLSRWLGHSPIQTTPIYQELVPCTASTIFAGCVSGFCRFDSLSDC